MRLFVTIEFLALYAERQPRDNDNDYYGKLYRGSAGKEIY
jgi:hypothetical protein